MEQIKADLQDAELTLTNHAEYFFGMCIESNNNLKNGLQQIPRKTSKSKIKDVNEKTVQILLNNIDTANRTLDDLKQANIEKQHAQSFEDLYRMIDSLLNEIMQKPGQHRKVEKEQKIPKAIQRKLQG